MIFTGCNGSLCPLAKTGMCYCLADSMNLVAVALLKLNRSFQLSLQMESPSLFGQAILFTLTFG